MLGEHLFLKAVTMGSCAGEEVPELRCLGRRISKWKRDISVEIPYGGWLVIRKELLIPPWIEVRELNALKYFHWSRGRPDPRAFVFRGPVEE